MGPSNIYLVAWNNGLYLNPAASWANADLFSVDTKIKSLIWGNNFFIFKPDVPRDHAEYVVRILIKYHQHSGPYPPLYGELADEGTLAILSYMMNRVLPEPMKPFSCAGEREISREDRTFVLNIMKMDPRDRPTARDLLDDVWFKESDT